MTAECVTIKATNYGRDYPYTLSAEFTFRCYILFKIAIGALSLLSADIVNGYRVAASLFCKGENAIMVALS